MKVRNRRLRAVQADIKAIFEAIERIETSGHSAAHHRQDLARLECREQELLQRIRAGADMKNGGGLYQRAKTHCPSGHEYGGENLIVDKRGYRKCRKCKCKHDLERLKKIKTRVHGGVIISRPPKKG